MTQSMANFLRSVFRAWLPILMLGTLLACSGGSSGGPAAGSGAVGYAGVPVQDAGVAAPNADVLDGALIIVRTQVVSANGDKPGADGLVRVQVKGRLTDKLGNVYSKSAAGRYVRYYDPTRRQIVDRLIQEGNTFEADLEVKPEAYDPLTKKTIGWCFFAVPQEMAEAVETSPKACPLAAPQCFEITKDWIDFLNEDFINDPCPLLNPPP